MKMAYREAEKALEKDEIPVGAVVVMNQMVIGRGHNLTQTLQDVTAHAEMQAITAATNHIGAKYLNDCTLYVTLEPCVMCAGAMMHARLSRVIFAARDPKTGVAGSLMNIFDQTQLNHHTQVTQGVLADDCATLLKDFFANRRQAAAAQKLQARASASSFTSE